MKPPAPGWHLLESVEATEIDDGQIEATYRTAGGTFRQCVRVEFPTRSRAKFHWWWNAVAGYSGYYPTYASEVADEVTMRYEARWRHFNHAYDTVYEIKFPNPKSGVPEIRRHIKPEPSSLDDPPPF